MLATFGALACATFCIAMATWAIPTRCCDLDAAIGIDPCAVGFTSSSSCLLGADSSGRVLRGYTDFTGGGHGRLDVRHIKLPSSRVNTAFRVTLAGLRKV
jgi:hypothetical protein